ncbi:DUF3710 domain-containing protein [Actinocrispum wychmicini]|uniref:Uncharacterized protein DUF3710 n=1 Tax=Actinocrispum wychmicini TaxID=1213861 RepID=A0A4R2J2F8_9PSEU|nr:DUF3710 domain-containing protein [Actinocrispum wychmicini]TCO52511.1 uncharacterized protein DUF3710 [Actinocrispum wychmicini]
MALFGRRRNKRPAEQPDEQDYSDYSDEGDEFEPNQGDLEELAGPFDGDVPDDGIARLDLGSLLLPVPEGAQLQVKMAQQGVVEAIFVITPSGQFTVQAYAAPRSGGLWEGACGQLAEQLKADGANVRSTSGEWGQELMASIGDMAMRVIGVDGPRWMLRAHVAGPQDQAAQAAHSLRTMVRGTVVVRGSQPWPVSEPLPIQLPPEIAQHIEAQGG